MFLPMIWRPRTAMAEKARADVKAAVAVGGLRSLIERAVFIALDQRGAALNEYVVVTGFVAVVAMPALLFAGVAVASSFMKVRNFILYPFP